MREIKRKIRAFCGNQGCVDSETEYLSPTGWKRISEYSGEPICVYDTAKGTVHFETPSDYIVAPAFYWYTIRSLGVDQKLSPEHNVFYKNRFGRSVFKEAELIYNSHQKSVHGFDGGFVATFKTESEGISIPNECLRLFVALSHFNHIVFDNKTTIEVNNEVAKKRIENLLEEAEVSYISKGNKLSFDYLDDYSKFPEEWLNLSNNQMSIVLDEVIFWNGSPSYYSRDKNNIDIIQYIFSCLGYVSKIYKGGLQTPVYHVAGARKKAVGLRRKKKAMQRIEAEEGEKRYCFTTSTGAWVARRSDYIFVTGNSGKDFSCSRLMMTRGFKKVAFADALREVAFKTIGINPEEGMKRYDELKKNTLINGYTFRNILEQLGSGIRRYDEDFWAKAVVTLIKECTDNICISDLRYPNEYRVIKKFADENNIDFKLIFCDYKSDRYVGDNPHESAALARYLKDKGYSDQEEVNEADVFIFELAQKSKDFNKSK